MINKLSHKSRDVATTFLDKYQQNPEDAKNYLEKTLSDRRILFQKEVMRLIKLKMPEFDSD